MLRPAALVLSAALLAAPAVAQAPRQTLSQNPAAAQAGTYALDKRHASVVGKVSHFGLSNYTFRFNRLDGSLQYDPRNLTRSRVTFTVDPASIDTGNESFNTELGGAGFLNGQPNAPARFVSTGLTATGPRTGRLTGDLTLNGVTRPAVFAVTFNAGGNNMRGTPTLGFSAEGVIKRSDYKVAERLPAAVVGDDIRLVIEAEFNKSGA